MRAYPLSERGVVLYIRDATDEREREIGRLQSEKLASIGMLAAGVAHEINNPAAFVLANIEALTGHMRLIEDKLRELPERGRGARALSNLLFEASAILQESKEGMARIQRIVRDLGSFSHADEDVSVPMSVNTAVESALTMLRNELKYRARVEQDLRATRLVLASAPRLGQVFLNLILERRAGAGRSRRQAQPGARAQLRRGRLRRRRGERQRARHRARRGAADLRVVLHDQAPRHGDRAGPADPARHRAQPGRRDHRREPAGEGATSGCGFPPRAAAPAARRRVGPRDDANPPFSRRRILAVDDEALLLKAYRRMLTDAHELVTALGGHEALGVLQKDARFDVVLCDLQMPEMSGMELHAAVTERYPGARRAVRVRHRRRVLRRRAPLPRGGGARRSSRSRSTSTTCCGWSTPSRPARASACAAVRAGGGGEAALSVI